ncbi:TPA: hypothetical protein L0122_001051 [Citrobacter freundii]|nr:hypothetical protein [Citrobacter freundii]
MGFPSPAGDYVEQRFSPASMCITNTSRILETSSGYAIIEPVTRLVQNQVLLILSGGRTQFARVMGRALICDDGEAIEGEALDGVTVIGPVTALINAVGRDDDCPVP